MIQIQLSLKIKKIETRHPEHSLTPSSPHPLHPITSHFCFVEQILDTVMKLVPIEFLSILKGKVQLYQYIKGKVFSFSVTLRPNCLICSLFSAAGIQLHSNVL